MEAQVAINNKCDLLYEHKLEEMRAKRQREAEKMRDMQAEIQ